MMRGILLLVQKAMAQVGQKVSQRGPVAQNSFICSIIMVCGTAYDVGYGEDDIIEKRTAF